MGNEYANDGYVFEANRTNTCGKEIMLSATKWQVE